MVAGFGEQDINALGSSMYYVIMFGVFSDPTPLPFVITERNQELPFSDPPRPLL